MDLIIVPAWRRPEFLAASLSCVARTALDYDGQIRIWIALDHGYSPEVAHVAHEFARQYPNVTRVIERDRRYDRGNSYNVLTAYADALATKAERIHLIEEDVFVAVDYLSFARQAHKLVPEAFAVSACYDHNAPGVTATDEDAVYLRHDYQSLAVSFTPDKLQHVAAHAHPDYFSAPLSYCRSRFPNSRLESQFAEQDGLIRRVIEARSGFTTYPAAPRAYHAGFYGYNRAGDPLPAGDITERSRRLLAMTDVELNDRALSYPDHQTVDLGRRRAPVTRVVEV